MSARFEGIETPQQDTTAVLEAPPKAEGRTGMQVEKRVRAELQNELIEQTRGIRNGIREVENESDNLQRVATEQIMAANPELNNHNEDPSRSRTQELWSKYQAIFAGGGIRAMCIDAAGMHQVITAIESPIAQYLDTNFKDAQECIKGGENTEMRTLNPMTAILKNELLTKQEQRTEMLTGALDTFVEETTALWLEYQGQFDGEQGASAKELAEAAQRYRDDLISTNRNVRRSENDFYDSSTRSISAIRDKVFGGYVDAYIQKKTITALQ